MKRSRPTYEAVSPRTNSDRVQDPDSDLRGNLSTNDSYSALVGESSFDDLDSLQQFLGFDDGLDNVQANTWNQANMASNNADAQRTRFDEQQTAYSYSGISPPGFAKHGEYAGLSHTKYQTDTQQQFMNNIVDAPYNPRRRSIPSTSRPSAITPMAHLLTDSPHETHNSPYSPYRGFFPTSDDARDHRHMSTRFGRQPYIAPADDPTIAEAERTRDHQVSRIYDAMVRGDRAQDNPGSIAMKRWVHGAHYKPDLVEAFAHKVFDCVLVQVKEGFRGWHHNDYVDDDRKGEKEDREADCMARLDNIVDALEREKTICEDVVNSASQIRMFVNAPIAYAARKYQNRLGNSKRGRTKDVLETVARPAKLRRSGRRLPRAGSTTVSDGLASRDTTPQSQTLVVAAMPYYATPPSPRCRSGNAVTHLSPQQARPRPGSSRSNAGTEFRLATATAPPMLAQPNTPLSTTSRSAMSPPLHPLSHMYSNSLPTAQMTPTHPFNLPTTYHHSAPPSPADLTHTPQIHPSLVSSRTKTWSGLPLIPTSDTVSDAHIDLSLTAPSAYTAAEPGFKGVVSHVSLADIERGGIMHSQPQPQPPPYTANDGSGMELGTDLGTDMNMNMAMDTGMNIDASIASLDPIAQFETFWNEQPGVQQFCFPSPGYEGVGMQ